MKYYNLHRHKPTHDDQVLELVNQYPWEFDEAVSIYSIGIHPWYIDELRLESDLRTIEAKLRLSECLALGECGLDKRTDIPMPLQIEVFERQIALAEKYQKPLVLHLVAAYDELLEVKKRLNITVPIIMHGFSKSAQLAQQLLSHDIYLSFGKYLLRNPDLKEVFQQVPNDRFFLETDTSEETIEQVYALATEYKGMTLEEMKAQLAANWKAVFG